MSEHGAKQDAGQDAGQEGSLAVRLRMAADGELDGALLESLETHLERSLEDRARIQFERELREAVGRVMVGANAPDALRARVSQIAEASRDADSAPALFQEAAPQDSRDEAPAPERMAPLTRRTSFWTRREFVGGLAAAAVLALASVFVVRMAGITSVPLNAQQEAYRTELVQHVAKEHQRMEDPEAASRKLGMHEPAEVEAFFSEVIEAPSGAVKRLIESTAECVFSGAGNCHIPGVDGAAAHVMLRVKLGERTAPVSVFVCPDPGQLPMKVGETYVIDTDACGMGTSRVLAWSDGKLLYVVVSKATAKACPSVLTRLGRKSPGGRL